MSKPVMANWGNASQESGAAQLSAPLQPCSDELEEAVIAATALQEESNGCILVHPQ